MIALNRDFILKIFDAFYMQRWNDKLRPIDLVEMDKQAHKMSIAYFLGKFEESRGINWIEIIEGGIFELLQRIVITDIKPPVYYKIKSDSQKYKKLNEFVYNELKDYISPFGEDFCERFRSHFEKTDDTLEKRILSAAHIYASKWEFDIIERLNPDGFEIKEIKEDFLNKIENYNDLVGMQKIATHSSYKRFIDLYGHLRFQSRWAQVHRIPKTSVLGHSLFVAILTYLFSLKMGCCPRRCFNNFFTGLFHDLPEVLTRDIISPVKRSIEGLDDLIKEYEKEKMETVIYPLLPAEFIQEIRMFTENEFSDIIYIGNEPVNTTCTQISASYNEDRFNPRDGTLVKAADDLSAYVEALTARENGCISNEFRRAMTNIKAKYENFPIDPIDMAEILNSLDQTMNSRD